MIQFVRDYVYEHIPEATASFDMLGNLYITKGEAGVGYPTLACHLDQVQTLHSEDFFPAGLIYDQSMVHSWQFV